VPASPIPTWKERLSACFRFRHRLLHVFGVPSAFGALTAVGTASLLNPDTGLALGALVASVGTLLAGYFVTAGFDRGLVERLQAEQLEHAALSEQQSLERAVWNAHPEIRPTLERIVTTHAAIEAVFTDGLDDSVERILTGSRSDLRALRDRAVTLVDLYRRLGEVLMQSDGPRLHSELLRLQQGVPHTPPGPARRAHEEALASAERTYGKWYSALERQREVQSALTVIEKNLEEFKLAMALRKADAVHGEAGSGDVSELQARLHAAGEACDELVGRSGGHERRARRTRA
jgi:hypothetical protein